MTYRDPDHDLRVRGLMRNLSVDDLKARERARVDRANKAVSDIMRNLLEPQQVPELRPASTNPTGAGLRGDDDYGVQFTDAQGVVHHNADDPNWVTDPTPGSTAIKAGDLQKCLDHAVAIKGIVEQPNFSPAAKRAAIRDANAKHAPECAGLCDQIGETASKAAPVAFNPKSETKDVGWFVSTNVPRRK